MAAHLSIVDPRAAAAAAGGDVAEPAIVARGLARWYEESGGRRVHALASRSFVAWRGEAIALVGRSGCGKSTLLRLLGLLDPPDAGSLVMLGRDVATLDASGRARMRLDRLGFVFQNFCLLKHRSVLENVELPLLYAGVARRERMHRAQAWLDRLGVQDLGHRHPSELSGGQQQRVAIARALVGGPAIVLADEPTGSLDPDTGTRVMDALFESCAATGATCIVATHDLALAQRFDRIEHMDTDSPAGPTPPRWTPKPIPSPSPGHVTAATWPTTPTGSMPPIEQATPGRPPAPIEAMTSGEPPTSIEARASHEPAAPRRRDDCRDEWRPAHARH